MEQESPEWNEDIAKITDPLQRTLAQGHFDRAKDATKLGRQKERINQLTQAGLINLREKYRQQHPTIKERIIFAPPLVKAGCAMTALGLCAIPFRN